MAPPDEPEPRAHHFVPQCWLSGFTETGQKSGRLWVTDLKKKKQWQSSPPQAGHRRDFYRFSDPQLDPVAAERVFSKIEAELAPVLRRLDDERRGPTKEELDGLLFFMAIQWTRVPAFRPTALAIADRIQRSWMSRALKSPETWAATLKELNIPADSSGAQYDAMRDFQRPGKYSLSAEPEWFLLRAFQASKGIVRSLSARRRAAYVSKRGSFIGSDNPVALDGPKDQMIGFKNADIVIYPVSRHVLLRGTNIPIKPPAVTSKSIAAHNTFAMLTSDEQVYSHVPDFCWLDENDRYQTDWRLFSREKF